MKSIAQAASEGTLVATGKLNLTPVWKYVNGAKTTEQDVGPSGKPLFKVGPFAAGVGGLDLPGFDLKTETPELFADGKLGTTYSLKNPEVVISNNDRGGDLYVRLAYSDIKKLGTTS